MFTPTSEAAFGKVGILCLRFRKTGRQIAALTLEQMCSLFYLKRATVGQGLMQMSSVGGGRWGDAAQESTGGRVEPFETVWVCGVLGVSEGWQEMC